MTSVISLYKIQIINSIKKNINNRDIIINSYKKVIAIDKETINDNHEKSNTQRSNQKSTKDEITTDVIHKISSSSNQNSSSTREHNITEIEHNGMKDKEIADKTDSNNNNNNNNKESKSSKKKVLILGDSILKYFKSYSLSRSLDNRKVYVKDFLGARVRCIQDYVRPTIRENLYHIIFNVGTNNLAANILTEKVAESIIDLASSLL